MSTRTPNIARVGGARILHPPTDYPYGERQYEVEDLGGHRWTFSQTIADVAPEEWGRNIVVPVADPPTAQQGDAARWRTTFGA